MADEIELLDPLTGGPYRGCEVCRHFDPTGMPRCAAYPNGIPLPILGGDLAHDRPLPGDHGIRFEPMTAAELRVREERLALAAREPASVPAKPPTKRAG